MGSLLTAISRPGIRFIMSPG